MKSWGTTRPGRRGILGVRMKNSHGGEIETRQRTAKPIFCTLNYPFDVRVPNSHPSLVEFPCLSFAPP